MSTNNTQAVTDALELALDALSMAAFAHPSAADDIGVKCSAAVVKVQMAIAQSRAQDAPPAGAGGEVPTCWHELKTDPEPFDAVMRGEKTCEIRRNDRDYKVGDGLLLRRTKYTGGQMHMRPEQCPLEYTGEECRRVISHVLTGYGLEDYVALSLTPQPQQADGRDAQDAKDARSDSVHLDSGASGNVHAPGATYEHQRAVMEGHRAEASEIWQNEMNYMDGELRAFDQGFESGWNRSAAILSTEKATAGGGGV